MDRTTSFGALVKSGLIYSDLPALTSLLTNEQMTASNILVQLVPEAIADVMKGEPQRTAQFLPSLEKLLTDTNSEASFLVALVLVQCGHTNNPMAFAPLHALFNRVNDRNNEYYKMLAADVLAKAGPAVAPLVPDLLNFAKLASEGGIQSVVYSAIAKISPDASFEDQNVAEALRVQNEDEYWAAKWKSGACTKADMRAALKNPRQAFAAAYHLAEMGAAAKDAVPDMLRAMWRMSCEGRRQIVTNLHKIDPQCPINTAFVSQQSLGEITLYLEAQSAVVEKESILADVNWLREQAIFQPDLILADELNLFTNKLAAYDQKAFEIFVKSNQ